MSVEDGLVYSGQRLIIPEVYRKEYLDRVHAGHQGITKSQLRAKDSIYWPNMMADIERTVGDCAICLQNAKSTRKEPMMSHEVPFQPWEVLSSDLFELEGHSYILLVDHFSKMPFVRGIKTTSCGEVIKFFKDMFAIHGVPKRLYSDNGPQYSATEFRNFALDWEFEHITSSPYYPQSNGFAERVVGIVKSVLKKAKQSGNDPQMALLCLRSTPIDSKTPSPAELLYGRKIRSNLPAKADCKLSMLEDHESLLKKSNLITEYYNKDASSELSELSPGMKVLVQRSNEQVWVPGTVKQKCTEPRSYVVEMPNGSEIRRNRRYLKELSPNASKKFDFMKSHFSDTSTDVLQPIPESHRDTACNVEPKNDQGNLTCVRSDIPVEHAFSPRKSARIVNKPTRLIEQCEMNVNFG